MFTEATDTKKVEKANTVAAGDVNHRKPLHAARPGAVAGLVAFGLAVTAIMLQSSQGSSGVNPGASQSAIAAAYAHTSGTLVWIGAYIQILAYLCLGVCLISLTTTLRPDRGHWTAPLPVIGAAFSASYVVLSLAGFAIGGIARYRAGRNLDLSAVTALVDVHVALYIAAWASAGFALACWAALILGGGRLPRWAGWSAAIVSMIVLLAVGLPTSPMSQLPNVLVLVWALGLSIVMLRRTAGQEG